MLNSSSIASPCEASTLKLYSFYLYQGSSPSSVLVCCHLATLEFQVAAQFSKDFTDDLVCSSQQQARPRGIRVMLASLRVSTG